MTRPAWPVQGSTNYVAETAAVIDDLQDSAEDVGALPREMAIPGTEESPEPLTLWNVSTPNPDLGPIRLTFGGATHNDVFDHCMYWGFNVPDGGLGGGIVPTEPVFVQVYEVNYEFLPDQNAVEWYIEYRPIPSGEDGPGGGNIRPYGVKIDKDTNAVAAGVHLGEHGDSVFRVLHDLAPNQSGALISLLQSGGKGEMRFANGMALQWTSAAPGGLMYAQNPDGTRLNEVITVAGTGVGRLVIGDGNAGAWSAIRFVTDQKTLHFAAGNVGINGDNFRGMANGLFAADGSAPSSGSGAGGSYLYSSGEKWTTPNKFIAEAGLGVGNSAAATSLGSVTKKMEVFDASGASLGFVPIYDSIS